jgi:phosphohistidine phosphatase SixA
LKLWIGRHGFAGDYSTDPKKERERPLKPEGIEMVRAVAQAMDDADEIPNVIFSSPFVRAVQTADILGKQFGIRVNNVDDLSPDRPLEDRILELMSHKEITRLMLVGHTDNTEPAFNNFGSKNGDDFEPLVMAEVRRLKIDRKSGQWKVRWGVKPSDLWLKDYGE